MPVFLKRNTEQNPGTPLTYRNLDWRASETPEALGRFDWIVGSDVLYEKEHSLILAGAVARHLKASGRAVITDPARPYLQTFVDEMHRLGFRSQTTVQKVADSPSPKEIFVVEFTRI